MSLPRYILHRTRNSTTDKYMMHANVDPGGSDEYAPVAMMNVQRYTGGREHVIPSLMPGASKAATEYHYADKSPANDETLPMLTQRVTGVPHHSVSELYTTERHRMLAPGMVGVAEMTARRETGKDLKPSDDLSPYSLQFSRHLASRGALHGEDLPPAPSNDLDFRVMEQQSAAWKSHSDLQSEVGKGSGIVGHTPTEDLTASGAWDEGRRAMRSVLRAGRPSRQEHFEQGTLF